jgi:PAS domain S-box-containing protein
MNRTLQIPNVKFLRNRQPSLREIENLLDYIPQGALLLDLDRNRILLANAKIAELTAFTRAELTNSDIEGLLPKLSNYIQDFPAADNSTTFIDTIRTHQGSNIDVMVDLIRLNYQGTWGLVILEPSELIELKAAEKKRQLDRYEELYSLASASQETDFQLAMQNALEAGHRLTGADHLALYLDKSNNPGLELTLTWGSEKIFPEFINPDIADDLTKPIIWTPGKRASNPLFQSARAANFDYLAYYPLGEQGEHNGLLVLAANNGEHTQDNSSVSMILAATISGIIKQHNLHECFRLNEMQVKHDLNIGERIKEFTKDGVILLSPELMIEDLNPEAETLLGYATQEICGQIVSNVLIGPSNLIPALQAAQDGISSPNLGEVHLHRRDGVAFLAHISTIPLMAGSQLQGVLIFFRDLSAHEEFEIRNQQLEQRALLGEVTAIFAHEVRNPINNISTGLQLMAMNLPQEDPNQEVISRLSDDCNRLTHLMQSVLTFSRPPENKFQKVELAVLIPTLLERWRPRLARLNVKHEFLVTIENSTIMGDPRTLEQVFSNLIGNSVEAMKKTGGTLTISIRTSHQEGNRQHIEINVIDNGPGIPNDLIDRIFEPFVTTNRNGTGLGLSIAKRIVTAHKGTICANSVAGGTVFQVIFPLAQDNEA